MRGSGLFTPFYFTSPPLTKHPRARSISQPLPSLFLLLSPPFLAFLSLSLSPYRLTLPVFAKSHPPPSFSHSTLFYIRRRGGERPATFFSPLSFPLDARHAIPKLKMSRVRSSEFAQRVLAPIFSLFFSSLSESFLLGAERSFGVSS